MCFSSKGPIPENTFGHACSPGAYKGQRASNGWARGSKRVNKLSQELQGETALLWAQEERAANELKTLLSLSLGRKEAATVISIPTAGVYSGYGNPFFSELQTTAIARINQGEGLRMAECHQRGKGRETLQIPRVKTLGSSLFPNEDVHRLVQGQGASAPTAQC